MLCHVMEQVVAKRNVWLQAGSQLPWDVPLAHEGRVWHLVPWVSAAVLPNCNRVGQQCISIWHYLGLMFSGEYWIQTQCRVCILRVNLVLQCWRPSGSHIPSHACYTPQWNHPVPCGWHPPSARRLPTSAAGESTDVATSCALGMSAAQPFLTTLSHEDNTGDRDAQLS